jgi:uncharacterized membrane protein YgaE (UPF0421/DUF939 family)
MDTLDTLTKSFDKLFITTVQNILGADIKICKWSFIVTSIGVGLSMIVNSFYLFKMNNENKLIKNKLDVLLNENKLILEDNITIHDFIKKNIKGIEITVNDKNVYLQESKNENNNEIEGYDFLYCE